METNFHREIRQVCIWKSERHGYQKFRVMSQEVVCSFRHYFVCHGTNSKTLEAAQKCQNQTNSQGPFSARVSSLFSCHFRWCRLRVVISSRVCTVFSFLLLYVLLIHYIIHIQ